MKRPPEPKSEIGDRESEIASSVPRLLDGILLFFLALAIALRPLLPAHRDEANLWVEMCVFVAALAWLVRAALAQRLRLERTGLGLPIAVLLAIAVVSTCRSSHPVASVATLLEWLAYGALFVVLVSATAGDGGLDRRCVLRLLWASAFVVGLYGLFQQFVNLPLLQRMIEANSERVLGELHMSSRHLGDLMARATGRIFATFLVSNSFAGFLALVFPGFLGYVLDRVLAGDRGRGFLTVSALWLAVALACLLLTFSKGGWVAFAVGMAAFAAMLGRRLLVRHARLLVGVAAAALAGFGLLVAVRVVPVQIFRDAVTSGDVRLGYWQGALDMAQAQPLGGVGLGTFGDHYPRYRPLLAHPAQDTHNDYLQVLAELGVPGLLAFLWLWAAYLRNVFCTSSSAPQPPTPDTQHRSPRRLSLLMACGAAAVAFLITTIVTDTFSLAGWWDESPTSQELKAWLDRALLAALVAAWFLLFAVLRRGEPREPGELCRKGLVCGAIAFLVHCALDFDYQEPGVAFTAWAVAALSVRRLRPPKRASAPAKRGPRREAAERRLGPLPAAALALAALLAVASFQFVLWRGTRAATSRDVAASLLTDAARASSPLRRADLFHQARQRYAEAVEANPLDDALRQDYGDLLVSLLVPPEPSGEVRRDERRPGSPSFHLRIETPADAALFDQAIEQYRCATELNRTWASPHVRIGGLYFAAARPDAGPGARAAIEHALAACVARRPPTGPNLLYLPAVAEFEEALACDPRNPGILLLVAEAREKLGDPAAAEPARQALEIDELLRRADPGHKVRMRPDEVLRAQALVRRAEPARLSP